MTPENNNGTLTQRVGFWLGLVLFGGLLLAPPPASMHQAVRTHFASSLEAAVKKSLQATGPAEASPQSSAYQRVEQRLVARRARVVMAAAAVSVLVACWWITVAVPIPVTSLLPLVLFPLVGVVPIRAAAAPYANPNVFLFMGGFMLALAIERWGLHRRIALYIVRRVGTSRATIVLGFMLASAFLSMWISNTATTLMMLPIGLAIITAVGELDREADAKTSANFSAALMLGIAYAASIGGVGTPIGTPPNIAFEGLLTQQFPAAREISFGHWMVAFVPLVLVFLPVTWWVLVRVTCPVGRSRLRLGRDVLLEDLRRLGPMRRPERRVAVMFAATALLWMTRKIPVGGVDYGWAGLLERLLEPAGSYGALFHAGYISDATVALGMAVLLFIIPAGERSASGKTPARGREFLLDWETAQRLPWGILLLFGGGFAIAEGFQASGLSFWCGQVFASLGLHNPLVVVVCTCLFMTFLTEITSNTATTQVMLPILARASLAMGVNPLTLMLPATISASCAFMLPVATPPNAIVFGSGHVAMGRMVRTGIILNLVGVVLVTAFFYLVSQPILGVDPAVVPTWAK